MKKPTIRQEFEAMMAIAPELKEVLEEGIKLRDQAVNTCVARDLPIAGTPEPQLKSMYEDFFFQIATDEMVAEMMAVPTAQLFNSAKTLHMGLNGGLVVD